MTIENINHDPATTVMVPVWTHIILHHTATSIHKTPEQIRQEHLAKGWLDIGYNYLVDYEGRSYPGRPLNIPGAHAVGWNSRAIGIAAIGNFSNLNMSAAQKAALIELIRRLMSEHHIPPENVLYHKDVAATLCPGANFPDIKAEINGPFRDVPTDHWAAASVAKAQAAGILGGYSDGTFRGNNPVTRYELAAFAAKLLERMN